MCVCVCVCVVSVCVVCVCLCVCVRARVYVCAHTHVDVCMCVILINLIFIQGIVMADRKFDTYMPGASEQLESFINAIMSGRYIFFVIKV